MAEQHELKTLPRFFARVLSGEKPFEVRRNDRDFQAGDVLFLREFEAETPQHLGPSPAWEEAGYTGRTLLRTVTYVLHGGQYGIQSGYVVLGLGELEEPVQ